MQRSKIKIGDVVGVVSRAGKDAKDKAVRATVEKLDAEYVEGSTYYGKTTKRDGILVRFDEPMSYRYGGIFPAAGRPKGEPTKTSLVVEDARHIVAPWSEIEAYREERDSGWRAEDEKLRAVAAIQAPRVERVRALLDELEVPYSENYYGPIPDGGLRLRIWTARLHFPTEQEGRGDLPTGLSFEGRLDAIEKILGIESTVDSRLSDLLGEDEEVDDA